MSRFLERLREVSAEYPEKEAFFNSRIKEDSRQRMTYAELDAWSDSLAVSFAEWSPKGKPVVVYGHKSPLMLVCFIAAAKAGLTYAPVDIAYPSDRVNDILDQIGHPLVVTLADDEFPGDVTLADSVVGDAAVREAALAGRSWDSSHWIVDETPFYLLFTSGSTGRPKGVQMPSRCVDAFMDYFRTLFPERPDGVSFNRVPYTFDVSLFDIIAGLSSGYTLFSLESEDEQSMRATFDALAASGLTTWISTPSFIEMCLVDPSFDQDLLPRLDNVILCGEVFRNATALKIIERFPEARVLNTYGPTETQAVTDIVVDENLAREVNPLPVGYLSDGVRALIRDPETGEELPCGEVGEIYLAGNTVSAGYYGRPDLTEAVFSEREGSDGTVTRCYKTGDKGYLDADGRLFCLGRLDFQVKLNGFRVELADVEQALVRIPEVAEAVVLPADRDGKVTHLVAHVRLAEPGMTADFARARAIKAALKELVPDYMVPKKIVFHEEFALNVNGKIDRKALA